MEILFGVIMLGVIGYAIYYGVQQWGKIIEDGEMIDSPQSSSQLKSEQISTTSPSGSQSQSRRTFLVKKRYLDAYLVANTVTNVGKFLKFIGGALGVVIGFSIVAIGGELSKAGDAVIVFGILGFIVGGLIFAVFYIWGIVVASNGQHLKASLDHAVNTSPFLNDDQKAKVMSLM